MRCYSHRCTLLVPSQRSPGTSDKSGLLPAVAGSVAAGMTWQLYSEGTVMQDWFAPVSPGNAPAALP